MTTRQRTLVTDPQLIRRALEHSDRHLRKITSAQFGVAVSTVTTWRQWRAEAAAGGEQWPSDTDIAAWQAGKSRRSHVRVTRLRWLLRRAQLNAPMLIDPTGTRRRLQALSAIGWRYSDLAGQLGVVTSRVGHLTAAVYPTVHRDTAAAVAAVYDRLSMQPGPSQRSQAVARNRGWATPLMWDDETIDDPKARPRKSGGRHLTKGQAFDEIAIERAMAGDPVHLTPAERAEAAVRLTGKGLSAHQVAERLRTTARSIVRYRSEVA